MLLKRSGLIQELTVSEETGFLIALVLTIVYCKSFNVLFKSFADKYQRKRCKIISNF